MKRLLIALVATAALVGTYSVRPTTQTRTGPQSADAIVLEQTSIKADDGVVTEGMLYMIPSKRPKTVVVTMHPNDDRQRHYMLRPAAERGYAGFGMKVPARGGQCGADAVGGIGEGQCGASCVWREKAHLRRACLIRKTCPTSMASGDRTMWPGNEVSAIAPRARVAAIATMSCGRVASPPFMSMVVSSHRTTEVHPC